MQQRTEKLPVIYLIDGSPAVTGAFVCARSIARSLSKKASVVLVIANDADVGPDALQDFSAVQRLPIRHLRRTFRAVLLYLPGLLAASIPLRRQMREDGACILIVNDFHLMQGAIARLLGFRGQVITWVRINPAAFGRIADFWLWAAKKASNKVVAVSRYIERLLPEGLATDLLYDSVDPVFEAEISVQPNAGRDFIFVGNYIPGKGQEVAIEALAHVVSECPEARIQFHGGDMGLSKNQAFRKSLEERAKALGVLSHVSFGGFASDPRAVLMGKYAAINLSGSEAFSMAVLEASACGLAVIASRSGGPEEIIEDGKTGFLIPVGDVLACADAMLTLCRDPALVCQMGRAGRERVISQFSQAAFRHRLVTLLDLD